METKKHPNLAAGIGGVIVVLFTLCLMPISCEQHSPTIVGPEVSQGIVQETLYVADPLIDVMGEETTLE